MWAPLEPASLATILRMEPPVVDYLWPIPLAIAMKTESAKEQKVKKPHFTYVTANALLPEGSKCIWGVIVLSKLFCRRCGGLLHPSPVDCGRSQGKPMKIQDP